MNREFADKWVAELRSGKWKQGKNALKVRKPHEKTGYCCLGVACEISGIKPIKTDDGKWEYDGVYVVLPDSIKKKIGIKIRSGGFYLGMGLGEQSLASLNDNGLTFNQIADVIDHFAEVL